MPTAREKQRLIEALAYINTHRKFWLQGFWVNAEMKPGCGTYGCLAGHLSITLNKNKPAVNVPAEVWKKKPADRTPAEARLVGTAMEYAEYVRADDKDQLVEEREINGETLRLVHVQHRANRLIGGLRLQEGDFDDLFHGDNTWANLIDIASRRLGTSKDELKTKIKQVAAENDWGKRKVKA